MSNLQYLKDHLKAHYEIKDEIPPKSFPGMDSAIIGLEGGCITVSSTLGVSYCVATEQLLSMPQNSVACKNCPGLRESDSRATTAMHFCHSAPSTQCYENLLIRKARENETDVTQGLNCPERDCSLSHEERTPDQYRDLEV